jgi:transglutaminase-like putative cysteine protease
MATRIQLFENIDAKVRWLDAAARRDAGAWRVVALARPLRAFPPLARAQWIHTFVRDRIHYAEDPNDEEEFADASTILLRGWDDCDGKARLVTALALAAGLEARIRPIEPTPSSLTHFQAELRWPGSESYRLAQAGGWIVSETCAKGVQLGHGAESAERDPATGKILMSV